MKIICYTTSYWHNLEQALVRCDGGRLAWANDPLSGATNLTHRDIYKGYFCLKRWHDNVRKWFSPIHCFIVCGTWSEPSYCTLPDVTVINAGVNADRPGSSKWDYSKCAFTAAMAYLLNRRDWDLAVHLTDDWMIGAVDWDALLREFVRRPETTMSTQWFGREDWPIAMKHPAVVKMLHSRLKANLVEGSHDDSDYIELEQAQLFAGSWWNPWPHLQSIRRDFGHPGTPHVDDEETMGWPFVRLPNPAYIERYERERTSLAKPVKSG